jgi:hypothetical protein
MQLGCASCTTKALLLLRMHELSVFSYATMLHASAPKLHTGGFIQSADNNKCSTTATYYASYKQVFSVIDAQVHTGTGTIVAQKNG